MGIVNMLLSLESGRKMLALPKSQNGPLEALMRDLREQAKRKGDATYNMVDRTEQHEHWEIVAMYAKYVARALKRENQRREKEEVVASLLDSIGISAPTLPKSVRQYAGSEAMKAPRAEQANCLIEVVGREFRPWADEGDLLQIDFSMTHLHGDSLYLVAEDHYLQLTGFRRTKAGWLALKNHYDDPETVDMIEDRLPSRYEIVGRVVHIFKGPESSAEAKPRVKNLSSSQGFVMPSLTMQNPSLTVRGAAQGQLSDRDVCLIHLDGRMNSPWVHRDDSVEVDFAVETPYKDGLYAVSVGGGMTVCNLRGGCGALTKPAPLVQAGLKKCGGAS